MISTEFKNTFIAYVATLWAIINEPEFSPKAAKSKVEQIFDLIPSEESCSKLEHGKALSYLAGMLLGELYDSNISFLVEPESLSQEETVVIASACNTVIKNMNLVGAW
jgi:hypothetical protein